MTTIMMAARAKEREKASKRSRKHQLRNPTPSFPSHRKALPRDPKEAKENLEKEKEVVPHLHPAVARASLAKEKENLRAHPQHRLERVTAKERRPRRPIPVVKVTVKEQAPRLVQALIQAKAKATGGIRIVGISGDFYEMIRWADHLCLHRRLIIIGSYRHRLT